MADYLDSDKIKVRIVELLGKHNLSQSEFADATGISRSTISNILSDKSKVTIEIVNKIIQTYPDCNPGWLIMGKEDFFEVDRPPGKGFENGLFGADVGLPPKTQISEGLRVVEMKEEISKLKMRKIEKIMVFYTDNSFEVFKMES